METLLSVSLDQIVTDVFETMLSRPVSEIDLSGIPEAGRLTAAVHFAGESAGALLLECAKPHACLLAELLTGVHHDTVDDDVLDALAELANMIGGNLKSALHGGAGLSMPTVVEGSDYSMRIRGANPNQRTAFACEDAHFSVTFVSERKRSEHH